MVPTSFIALAVAWLFAVGAAIGSFLNVVAYRVPRGISLVRPGSRCPACQHDIRWYHNIPILGWIVLRGRCYDCRARISPRYPIVEAIVAVMFASVAWVELSAWSELAASAAAATSVAVPIARIAYELVLLCTLLVISLIQADGCAPSLGVVWPPLAIGIAAALYWPWLRPLPAFAAVADASPDMLRGLLDTVGLAAGALLGLLSQLAIARNRDTAAPDRSTLVSLTLVGAFLGWQAAALIAALTAAALLAVTAVRRTRAATSIALWTFILWALTWSWACLWRHLDALLPWLFHQAHIATLIASAALVASLSRLTHEMSLKSSPAQTLSTKEK